MDIDNNLASTQFMSADLSEDHQYLTLTEKTTFDLRLIDQLSHGHERIRQAYIITTIFDRYIDHTRRFQLVKLLSEMLALRIAELKVDERGEFIVNVLRNRGQANLLNTLLSHFTQQRQQSLRDHQVFGGLKHLLMQHLWYQGMPIHVNSISVTLRRAVDRVLTTM